MLILFTTDRRQKGETRSALAFGLASVALASCTTPRLAQMPEVRLPPGNDAPVATAQSTTQPTIEQDSLARSLPQAGWEVVVPASDGQAKGPAMSAVSVGKDDVVVSFKDAPLANVAEALLGKVLGATFSIDPNVQARITLRTAKGTKAADLPFILDQALRLQGLALTNTGPNAFAIVSESKALDVPVGPRSSRVDRNLGRSFVAFNLSHLPANEMARLAQPIVPRVKFIQRADAAHILIAVGEAGELDALSEAIEEFDVSYLAGMRFRFIPIRHGSASTLVQEMQSLGSKSQTGVWGNTTIVALDRLGGILLGGRTLGQLDEMSGWITRLDIPGPDTKRRLRFMSLQHTNAEELAPTLALLMDGVATISKSGRDNANSAGTGAPTIASEPGLAAGSVANSSAPRRDQLRISAYPDTNDLIIWATDDEHEQVKTLIDRFDAMPDQVVIEATIAEVTLNDRLRFGVQWFLRGSGGDQLTFSTAQDGSVGSSFPGVSLSLVGTDARLALSALSTVTDVDVISSPQIMVLDNHTARLQVGDQVPIISQSSTGDALNSRTINTVQYRDTGIVLSVTPRITGNDTVIIEVSQEISEVVGTTSSSIDSPTIQRRAFESKVGVTDRSTVALGGLIRGSKSVGDTGVPGLSRIPIAGAIFRGRDATTRRTELVIFLTPRIVRSTDDARAVTKSMLERFRQIDIAPAEPAGP